MKEYAKFTIKDSDTNETLTFHYTPNTSGEIELRKLTDKLNILIINY